MPSRRQRVLNSVARYVQKPALALITPPWLARRVFNLNAMVSYRRPEGLRVTPTDLGGISGAICAIGDEPTRGTLLYIHGGAFVLGHLRGYRHLIARLAQVAGMRGVYIDYRLAPEHPFPAALDDVEAAYLALRADPHAGPVAIVGDSAGGNIVLALLQRLKRTGGPLPDAVACLSPVTDLRLQNPSLEANRKSDALVPQSWGARGVRDYLGGHDPSDPEASPLLGDVTGMPPTYLCVDCSETLYDDVRLMAEKLERAGVDLRYSEHEGLHHVWHLNVGRSPEADASVEEVGGFLREKTARPGGARR